MDGAALTASGYTNWNSGNLSVEYGSWSPYLGGAELSNGNTYGQCQGIYARIDKTVFVWGRIDLSYYDSANISGAYLYIKNFPFNSISNTAAAPVVLGLIRNINFPDTFRSWAVYMGIDDNRASLSFVGVNTGLLSIKNYFMDNTHITFQTSYMID